MISRKRLQDYQSAIEYSFTEALVLKYLRKKLLESFYIPQFNGSTVGRVQVSTAPAAPAHPSSFVYII